MKENGLFRAIKLITYAASTGAGAAILATVPALSGPLQVGALVGGLFLTIAPWAEFLDFVHVVPVTVARIIADWRDALDEHHLAQEVKALKKQIIEVIEAYERERIKSNRLESQLYACQKNQKQKKTVQPEPPKEFTYQDVFTEESQRIDKSIAEFMRDGQIKPDEVGSTAQFDAEDEKYQDVMEILAAFEKVGSFARRKLSPATTITEARFRDGMKVLEDAGIVDRGSRGEFIPTVEDIDEMTEIVTEFLMG